MTILSSSIFYFLVNFWGKLQFICWAGGGVDKSTSNVSSLSALVITSRLDVTLLHVNNRSVLQKSLNKKNVTNMHSDFSQKLHKPQSVNMNYEKCCSKFDDAWNVFINHSEY